MVTRTEIPPRRPEGEPVEVRRLPQPPESSWLHSLPPTMWEYHYIRRESGESALAQAELDALGADGWELVGVASAGAALHFYFKRVRRALR